MGSGTVASVSKFLKRSQVWGMISGCIGSAAFPGAELSAGPSPGAREAALSQSRLPGGPRWPRRRRLGGHGRAAAALPRPHPGCLSTFPTPVRPARAWEAEQGESPRGGRLTPPPTPPQSKHLPRARATCGEDDWRVAPGPDGGREEPGLAPPLPGPPLPSAGWRRAGRGPRVSLCLRHRPRSCRRPSGRYPGPGAGGAGHPGARPR